MRTDVKSYYDSIDHHRLLELRACHVKDRAVLNLLWQSIRRTVTFGGLFEERQRGLPRGSPLSPLLGALYLDDLDQDMARRGVFYVRYMDDIVVLARTRWSLKGAVRQVNQGLDALGLAKAPDKTFIGRIDRGFDFLGYHFRPNGLSVADSKNKRPLRQGGPVSGDGEIIASSSGTRGRAEHRRRRTRRRSVRAHPHGLEADGARARPGESVVRSQRTGDGGGHEGC
jgi:hypothetical protein